MASDEVVYSSPLWELETALVARLMGDATLAGMITGIFDSVPEFEEFPYVQMDGFMESPRNTFGGSGKEFSVLFHIFDSQDKDRQGLYAIANAFDRLLDRRPKSERLDLGPNHYLVDSQLESANTVLVEPDGVKHMPRRYRLWTAQRI